MIYRVRMTGRSATASYDGYIDVLANSEKDAKDQAKQKLIGPTGIFVDRSPSMFHVTKVEKI